MLLGLCGPYALSMSVDHLKSAICCIISHFSLGSRKKKRGPKRVPRFFQNLFPAYLGADSSYSLRRLSMTSCTVLMRSMRPTLVPQKAKPVFRLPRMALSSARAMQ